MKDFSSHATFPGWEIVHQKCCQSSSRLLKLNFIRNTFLHGADWVLWLRLNWICDVIKPFITDSVYDFCHEARVFLRPTSCWQRWRLAFVRVCGCGLDRARLCGRFWDVFWICDIRARCCCLRLLRCFLLFRFLATARTNSDVDWQAFVSRFYNNKDYFVGINQNSFVCRTSQTWWNITATSAQRLTDR